MAYSKKAARARVAAAKKAMVANEERAAREGYTRGFAAGEERMEAAKAGGILDLQQQLDKARQDIDGLRKFRQAVVELLIGEMK